MKLEIESTVNFITHLIKLYCYSSEKKINEKKLKKFTTCLQKLLERRYKSHWFPDKPFKASGYRAIRIWNRMDPVLHQASQQCNISPEFLIDSLPLEITIWVDPQEVSYKFGSDSKIYILYEYKKGVDKPWSSEIIKKNKNKNPRNILSCFNYCINM